MPACPLLVLISNVYVSLQTCHFLQLLEADVHVLRANEAAPRSLSDRFRPPTCPAF